MNNTSYQIRYSAMDTFYMQVSQRIGAWKEDLAAIQTALNNVVNMEGFSGDAADNLRAYVSEVHLLAYQTLLQVMSEYQTRLLLYKDGYHDIDSNIYATMTKWTMSDYYNKVQQNEADMLSEAAAIRQALMNVSDLLWVGEPGKGTLQTDMEYILSESDKLDAAITSYESAEQARAINSLTNLLDSLHEMLTYYKGLNSDIQGYQKGDYATNEIIQTLAGNYQVSMEYLADNQEAANAAYERLSASYEQMRADYEAACEAREDAGRAEIIMGLAAVVVGTAAIICTAGAATPVVVALGVTAGAGSVMYGVSNITEGGQEVYYGATGDLESASWNPIRDTVFCGNQSAYDAWGNLNMTIAGLCIPISGAVAQSAAQGGTVMAKTVAVTTAKELFKDKVSDFAVAGIVGAMEQQFDLNQTEQALWTIGLNVGLDKLGDGVSARFKNTASTSPISTDTVQNLKAVEYGSGIDVASGAAKVDVDVKPLDGGAAGIGKNADGNLQSTDFVSGMSASDAARYNAWVDSCINGTHNGYPGLSVDDIAKFEIADAHVAEAIAVSKVDADAYLNLKAVEYGSGIKNVAEAPKAEVDIKPLEGATVGSESGRTTVIYGSDDIANYQYNMIENPGPLAEMPNQPAKNFYGGRYNMEVLQEDRIMYRAGNAQNPYGRWFTSEPPASVANVRIDTAVKPYWIDPKTGAYEASSYIDNVYAIKVPKGTTIYTGPVGPQGGAYVGGYNVMQTYIDAPWTFEVVGKTPLQ